MRKLLWGLWWLCLVFTVAVGGWFVRGMFTSGSSDDPSDTVNEVGCAEAMRFAGASMPEGTSEEDCTSYSWQDQAYDGTFRMPRSAVRGWLATSFPDAERPATCDGDLCVIVSNDPNDEDTTGAYDVSVSVRYEGESPGNTALVTFEASTY
ncbi:hypothetical protein [Streptomyces sp. NPDC001315]|uniref:hypothetical protein n=1 Tax=Streptomyces sp. NPDC001315 TaxID=3364562 RepID=UPI003683A8BF